ncbi:AAA family ATPase [Leptothrix sp. BB-4]
MTSPLFLTRVVLRNYRSIGQCDVRLGALTYLVGANGSGKSNFIDAMHLVRDALTGSLEVALNERGGWAEVRRHSRGHPRHFGIRLEFTLRDGRLGHYAFNIGALADGGFEVASEECSIGGKGNGPHFKVERGRMVASSEGVFPALTPDRLALVTASGFQAFRPAFDALVGMGFYNLNPKVMRELQKPQDGRLLKPVGENIASVIAHLQRHAPASLEYIEQYLQMVVPAIEGVERKSMGPLETLEFKQRIAGSEHPWGFSAQAMSDGTLRALGVLTALFQGNPDHAPSLVGIEEPETALHPAASRALRDALQRASLRTQVIVTSHSPDLLDDPDLPAESIRAVLSQDGETRIGGIDEGSRKTMREHLFTAGELLRLGQLSVDAAELSAPQVQISLFGDLGP